MILKAAKIDKSLKTLVKVFYEIKKITQTDPTYPHNS